MEQGKPSGSYSENKLTIIGVNGVSSDPIDLNPSISTGAGLLIVPSSFIGTANITITDAFDTVVVNNQPITGNISLTNGQYKVSVTQFGSVTKEANVLVLGNTNLVMDFSIFTVGIDGVESMTVGGISIPVGDVTVLKNDADVEVKLTLETLADGLTFTVTKSMNCANDATITADMTDMLIIQNDTTITIKNTAEYEVWVCGGGCGGSGGRAGGYVLSNDSYYAGDYGVAGNGGYVISKRINLNANDTIPIIIGAGGAGGAGGASDRLSGKAGTPGGTTTFGTYLSAVGGSSSPYSGGCGSNRTNMDIFGQSVAYGRGASGVDWSSNPVIEKGSKSGIDTSLPFPNAGDGGDGGVEPHGRTTSSSQAIGGVGGKGGNGLSDVYGKGGNGGDGGDRSYGGATGGNGTNGAVAIRRKIA